jgi:hypothetical protein
MFHQGWKVFEWGSSTGYVMRGCQPQYIVEPTIAGQQQTCGNANFAVFIL